jgi:hypothetical protein
MLRRRDRQHFELARLIGAGQSGVALDHQRDAASHDIGERLRGAAGVRTICSSMLLRSCISTMEQPWKLNVGTGFQAPPMTFELNGKQYVAVRWREAPHPEAPSSLALEHCEDVVGSESFLHCGIPSRSMSLVGLKPAVRHYPRARPKYLSKQTCLIFA